MTNTAAAKIAEEMTQNASKESAEAATYESVGEEGLSPRRQAEVFDVSPMVVAHATAIQVAVIVLSVPDDGPPDGTRWLS